jgi:hypothetical protein
MSSHPANIQRSRRDVAGEPEGGRLAGGDGGRRGCESRFEGSIQIQSDQNRVVVGSAILVSTIETDELSRTLVFRVEVEHDWLIGIDMPFRDIVNLRQKAGGGKCMVKVTPPAVEQVRVTPRGRLCQWDWSRARQAGH